VWNSVPFITLYFLFTLKSVPELKVLYFKEIPFYSLTDFPYCTENMSRNNRVVYHFNVVWQSF